MKVGSHFVFQLGILFWGAVDLEKQERFARTVPNGDPIATPFI